MEMMMLQTQRKIEQVDYKQAAVRYQRVSVLEAMNDNKPGSITATATSWGPRTTRDGRKYCYMPEAFEGFIKDLNAKDGKGEAKCFMYWNHNDGQVPIGYWSHAEVTDDSLVMNGQFFMNNAAALECYNLFKSEPELFGDVSVSVNFNDWETDVQFYNAKGEPDKLGEYFGLKYGFISETSIVSVGANPDAVITSLESVDRIATIRGFEKALKEHGFSNSQAKKVIHCYSQLNVIQDKKESTVIADSVGARDSHLESNSGLTDVKLSFENRVNLTQQNRSLENVLRRTGNHSS